MSAIPRSRSRAPSEPHAPIRVSISIHVYGADIGTVRRHTYPPEGGRKAFVSGYANAGLPLLRNRPEPPRSNPSP